MAALLALSGVRPASGQSSVPQQVTVNLLTQGEPDTLDPNRTTFAFAAEAGLVRQVFEPLLRLDAQLMPQPAAAESYEVSPDGTVYTFHLRPDGRWSDGQRVTAQQFEYAWKRLLDPTLTAEYAQFFVDAGIVGADDYHAGRSPNSDGVGVRAIDDATLEIRLNQPFGPLPQLAAMWVVSPLRQDVISANLDGWAGDPATYIGNGPFMLSEWVHQDHITLVQNPNYAAHGVWPAPGLTRVTVRMATSVQADYAAFVNGERDWAVVPDAELNAVLNDPDQVHQAQAYTDLTTFWVQLNSSRAPLNNVIVRRALAKALDRKAIVRDLTAGVSVPITSVLPPGMPGHQPGLGAELDFDPEGARTLLGQAGFAGGRGFPRLMFSYPSGAANQRRADYLSARWREILGIDVALSGQTNAAYQQALHDRAYDMAFGGWAADYPDPQDWFAPVFGCSGAYNYYAYCSSAFDQLVARGDMSPVLADRLTYYGQAQTQLLRDAPVIPLFVRGRLVLVKPWIQSVDGGALPITAQDDFPGSYQLDRVQVLPH
jgi:oligopeptide transport system substrate-binding protein